MPCVVREHRRIASRATVLAAALVSVLAARPSAAQGTTRDTARRRATLPASCPAVATTTADTASRARVRQLAREAGEAELTGDIVRARDLFGQAAALAPADADVAYHLARAHDALGERVEAVRAYCRYVALSPNASDAADVRARILDLAPVAPSSLARADAAPINTRGTPGAARDTVRRSEAAGTRASPSPTPLQPHARDTRLAPPTAAMEWPNPAGALARGLLVPGLGQFYTHRPLAGALVLGAAAGAVYIALKPHDVTTTGSFDGPFGTPHEFQHTTRSRPNLTAGFAAAAAISVIGAVEAYRHARGQYRAHGAGEVARASAAREPTATPLITSGNGHMGLGLALRF